MLKDFAKAHRPEKEEVKVNMHAEQARLAANQMRIKEAKVPVMVIFEGWGAAGKGSCLSRVIKDMDPRFFQVATMDGKPTEPPCKGSTFKGPFHLPRMLGMVDGMLGQLLGE